MAQDDRSANVILSADTRSYEQSLRGAEQSTNALLTTVTRLTEAMGNIARAGGRNLQLIGAGTTASLVAAGSAAGRLQSQMQQLEASNQLASRSFTVTERTVNQLRGSMSLGTNEVVGLVTQLNKMGQSNRNVAGIATEFVRLGAVTGEHIPALVDGMVNLQRQFGNEGLRNTQRYSSTLAHLATNAGVSAQGILSFSNAIAPVAQMAQISQTEVMGFATAFQRAGQDGFYAANAFNQIVTDISRSVQFGGPQLQTYANLVGVTAEEFRRMPVSESIVEVFDVIASQGPTAIKTLESLGMEGLRTQRAFAAVAGQGGLRGSQEMATQGGTPQAITDFAKAADNALSGLNDQMGILGNNLTRITQGFGAGILPALEMMVTLVNRLISPLANVIESLGMIPGAAAALGVAMPLLMGGTLLRAAPALLAAGGATQIGRSAFMGGFRATGALGGNWQNTAWVRRARESYVNNDSRMGLYQRGTYNLGARLGAPVAAIRQMMPGAEQGGPGLFSRGLMASMRGGGWLGQMLYDPLRPRQIADVAAREQLTRGWSQSAFRARAWGMFDRGMDYMRGTGPTGGVGPTMPGARLTGMAAVDRFNAGAEARRTAAVQASTTAYTRNATVLGTATQQATRFSVALARAGAGAAMLGGSYALQGAGRLGGVLGRGMGALAGTVGGAAGITLLGGMLGYGQFTEQREREQRFQQTNDFTTPTDDYRSAVGEAAVATRSFAQTLKDATRDVGQETGGGSPWSVSERDVELARSPGYEYTATAIGSSNRRTAPELVATAMFGASNEQKQLMELDLIKRFGPTAAQEIMREAADRGPGAIQQFGTPTGITGFQGGTIGNVFGSARNMRTSEEEAAALGVAVQSINQTVMRAPESQQAQLGVSMLNQAAFATVATGGPSLFDASLNLKSDALTKMLVGESATDQDREHVRWALQEAFDETGNADPRAFNTAFWNRLSEGDSAVATHAQWLMQNPTVDITQLGTGQAALAMGANPWTAVGVREATQGRLRGTALGALLVPGITARNRSSEIGMDIGTSGTQFQENWARGRGVSSLIEQALGTQLQNPGFQQMTAAEMWRLARDTAGSNAEAEQNLRQMINAIDDTTDHLSQLGEAAIAAGRGVGAFEMAQMSRGERAATLVENLRMSQMDLAQNPEDPQAMERTERDRAAVQQEQLDLRSRELDLLYQHRSMTISIGRAEEDNKRNREYATEDFYRQRGRQEADFNRSVSRQEESRVRQLSRTYRDFNISRERNEFDFNLSRQRQDEAYARQLSRTWRDFNIGRERGEYEFYLQRSRAEHDFHLQRQRAQRDFNISRGRAMADYNLSRRRQEQDFNHQLVLMAQQSARQVYNIYERVAVARTLSGTNLVRNLADQQQRLEEQNVNLERVRELGLSNDAIRMLGLNESGNAQQLSRLIQDILANPELIAQMNEMVTARTGAAGELVMDEANQQWEEMRRQYELSVERAAEDFARGMDRQAEDFARGLSDMRDDYNRAMSRSQTDFNRARAQQREDFIRGLSDQRTEYNIQVTQAAEDFERARQRQLDDFQRSMADQATEYAIMVDQQQEDYERVRAQQLDDFERGMDRQADAHDRMITRMQEDFQTAATEITGDMTEIHERAMALLSGTAAEQFEEVYDSLHGISTEVGNVAEDVVRAINSVMNQLGIFPLFEIADFINPFKSATSGRRSSAGSGGGARVQAKAEGGPIEGQSPHPKADNIPIMATAGEYVIPVAATQKYGPENLEKLRTGQFPPELLMSFANGGLVPTLIEFGKHLRTQGYHVGEHPSFGGVHPTAHLPTHRGGLHYIGHAIDVNYDGYGQGRENLMLDRIIPQAERLGLGYIWRAANHYDHAHFDTSNRRRLNGRESFHGGMGAGADVDADGNFYDKKLYDALRRHSAFKRWEGMMRAPIVGNYYIPNSLAKYVSIMSIAGGGDIQDTSTGTATGVQRWRPHVLQVLDMINQPRSLAEITLRRMNQESSGNPRAINLWDSNAKAGTPSKGLMQVIDPTFEAYKHPRLVDDIWNPMSNIAASMRYALSRYGSIYKAYSRAGGYANGGQVTWHNAGGVFTSPRIAGVAEQGPEAIIPLNGQGVEFMTALMRRVQGDDPRQTFVNRNSVPTESKVTVYHAKYDHSTTISGPINVAADDPRKMLAELNRMQREQALLGRNHG